MKREVLYRAKTRGSGEWVYGYYCKYGKHIHKIHSINKDGYAVIQCEIDIVTLCEYANLKDKNGVKIFEDDIIKTSNGKLCRVVFEEFQFFLTLRGVYVHRLEKEDDGEWEVVGNIYDNPELLS